MTYQDYKDLPHGRELIHKPKGGEPETVTLKLTRTKNNAGKLLVYRGLSMLWVNLKDLTLKPPSPPEPFHWTPRERKLMNTWGSMLLAATVDPVFCAKSNEAKMEWARELLTDMGFPTIPMGANWLYLTEPETPPQ